MLKKHAPDVETSFRRVTISGVILVVFWGLLLYDYWPDLASSILRLVNSAQGIGAKPIESHYFEVFNNSNASEAQVLGMVGRLEKQYEILTQYLQVRPDQPLPVLVINGNGPSLFDGSKLVLNDAKGVINTDLAPLFMVVMIEGIHINPAGGFVQVGGHALQVVEATGLGNPLIRQPLDAWAVLLRQQKAYIPLEEAWNMKIPSDDDGAYNLIRAMLESGSFMRWFTAKYGMEAARRVAGGEAVDLITGKPLPENEAEWLKSLDEQKITPKSCDAVIPKDNMFSLMCRKLQNTNHP